MSSHAFLLARVAKEIMPSSVSSAAMESSKICVLDYLGATLAGMNEGPSRIVRDWVKSQGCRSSSTLLGTTVKTSAHLAALANGTAGHMIELDDVHGACIGHPAVAVIPAALALAEAHCIEGSQFLASVISGYEVMARLGAYMGISHYKVWHPTATLGAIGAAASSVQVLGLDEGQAVNAIAIASTMASGLREVFVGGSNCKHIHPGLAARNGVMAAELSMAGFTGPETAIEGGMGFREAHSGTGNENALRGLPGGRYHIQDTEFKVFASCRSAHTAAEAGILMGRSGVEGKNIESITIEMPRTTAEDPAWGSLSPRNPLAAKLSIAYNFVVSLLDKECYLDQFTPERVMDPQLMYLMSQARIKASEEMDAYYPEHVGVRATVSLKDGSEAVKQVIIPRGHPQRPLLSNEVPDKFSSLVRPILGDKASLLNDLVMNLDEKGSVKELISLCASARV